MNTRTVFLALCVLLLAFPAMAQSASSSKTTLSKEDEAYLSEMPVKKFPGAAEMQDKNGDGIVDSEQAGGIPNPFGAGATTDTQDKPNVQYVYKPTSTTTLRRTIIDDRIDDGYVQGYMQQHGPQ